MEKVAAIARPANSSSIIDECGLAWNPIHDTASEVDGDWPARGYGT
jgi:hypothetical protein